jgi:magnesium transporter
MQCIIIFSSLLGISLPFIFTKLKLDPAAASAPIISSLSDIMGVIIYFSIATLVLRVF